MKTTPILILMAIFLFASFGSLAQLRAFDCEGSSSITKEKGREMLTKTQGSYASLTTIRGAFDQESYMAALDISEISSGTMWFRKPGNMRWTYDYPLPQDFIVKENTFWFYQPTQNQVTVNKLEKAFLSELPVSFLLGVGDVTEQFEFQSGCSNRDGVVLSLSRKGEDQNLKTFSLLINESTGLPRGARVEDVGGNVTTIVIRNPVSNSAVSDEKFNPSFPAGTDIDDQRGVFG